MPHLDIDRFLTLPRLSGLRRSPDGRRLIVSAALPDAEGTRFTSALWDVDPSGERSARRLTRSAPGESSGEFLPDGSIVFTSSRPDPGLPSERRDVFKDVTSLWLLPPDGGEAQPVCAPHGGVEGVRAARQSRLVVFASGVHPGAAAGTPDEERQRAREKAGVSAHLYETFPIRYWDHYLGPRARHLFTVEVGADGPDASAPVDLTPDAADELREVDFDITPDGATVIAGWRREDDLTRPCVDLVAIDVASRTRRVLAAEDAWHTGIRTSPDGRWVACVRTWNGDLDHADRPVLLITELATGAVREVAGDLGGHWPHDIAWAPDSASLLLTADRLGHVVVVRINVDDGALTQLGTSGAWADVSEGADGALFGLHATLTSPPRPARLVDGGATLLPFPGLADAELGIDAVAERLSATAADGTAIGSWLVRPASASPTEPAPVVTFIHGGPVGSWSGWHWRWNANILAARGYAVLMPDPGISTGYGQAFVDRLGPLGRGALHGHPRGARRRPRASRPGRDPHRRDGRVVRRLHGQLGGWPHGPLPGHRHPCLAVGAARVPWHDRPWPVVGGGVRGPVPRPVALRGELAPPVRASIRTPMLVIHGELDQRVPISEALRLWTDLQRHGVPSRFLYFPDENHWVLKPQNARLWYQTVLAFLDETVLGRAWVRPDLV